MTKTHRIETVSANAKDTFSAFVARSETSSISRDDAASDDIRRQMIQAAAYFRAEKRGFPGGTELQDWIEAEAEVDQVLAEVVREAHY